METQEYTTSNDQIIEHITLPGMVFSFLKKIKQGLCLLTIQIPDHNEQYSSFLLDINQDEDFLILDEFLPRRGLDAVKQAKKINVYTLCHGSEIRFSCDLLKAGEENGIPYYKVGYPYRLRYQQKRIYFRVPVSASQNIPTLLPNTEIYDLEGRLRNISLGGINVSLNRSAALKMKEGTLVDNCIINFPGSPLNCQLEICHVSQSHDNNFHVGGNFINLTNPQRQMVRKIVSSLERDFLRKIQQSVRA
jgi:c-di-GMP-binding flagellar brake protein YcgR